MGLRQERERGVEYDALIDEFFTACQNTYGRNVLLQVCACVLLYCLPYVHECVSACVIVCFSEGI
jgi:hypothetical protein